MKKLELNMEQLKKSFDGYHFVKMDNASAPAAGVVTAKDQHVIYVYEKTQHLYNLKVMLMLFM